MDSKQTFLQSQYSKFSLDAEQKTKDQFNEQQNPEKSVYFTDEVKIRIENEERYVNEFKILNNIGKGSFSKVKKVLRQW